MKALRVAISLLTVAALGVGLVSGTAQANPGDINAVAGTGTAGYTGDGGQATLATMRSSQAVAMDGTGNIYVAESTNHVIRKVTPAGVISTVAGNGSLLATSAPLGEGVAATSVSFKGPNGVAVDSTGNIYIADASARVVRKVTVSTGAISTVAGTAWTSGNGGDGGQATSATLSFPQGLAFDASGNLYIADFSAGCVRKVDSSGVITTVAGGGALSNDNIAATTALLKNPSAVAFDSTGDMYIAESNAHKIRKVTKSSGLITTVAGTGNPSYSGDNILATSADLWVPIAVAVDSTGNIYISDQSNARIRKVDATLGIITTVAGNGTKGSAGDGGPAINANLYTPSGIAVNAAGDIWIPDQAVYKIRKVTASSAPAVGVSPPGGSFSAAQTVTLTSGATVSIYYTLDGSVPNVTSSKFTQTGTIPISSSTTLKFFAIDTSTGAASSVVTQIYTIVVATVPQPPVFYYVGAGNGQAAVAFTQPYMSDGGSAITGYTVTSNPAGGTDINANTTATYHTITGLVNGTAYTFTVKAKNAIGTSASSAPSDSVTPMTVPDAPTNVVAVAGNGQATVYFTAPVSNGGSPITGYQITPWPAIPAAYVNGTASPIVVTGLTNGTAYSFVVQAISAAGLGATSVESIAVTPVAPPVNGACGTANGTLVTVAPSTNLCVTGTASSVTGTGPWSWTCDGANGGTTASCSALFRPLKAGDCDNSGVVTIAEVQSAINMYLGINPVTVCVDSNNSGTVTIDEVQKVINAFLGM